MATSVMILLAYEVAEFLVVRTIIRGVQRWRRSR